YTPADLFHNRPMVRYPEQSTIASVARLRIAGKPLVISEWNHCWMNEWMSEAPLLMAAYGSMQGWDGMLQFTIAGTGWEERMTDVFNVGTKPHWTAANIPAAIVFLRGDIPITPTEYTYGIRDADEWLLRVGVDQQVGEMALRQRVALQLDASEQPLPQAVESEYVSQHRLLRWRRDGVLIIDAPRTQGALGFVGGKRLECQHVRIEVQTPFCQVVLTALDDLPLPRSRRILLVAVARAENAGQVYSPRRDSLLDEGRSPILMEPVQATVTLKGIRASKVHVLDHHGRRTGATLPLRRGKFSIGKEKTFWYEIETAS
ncbi:MAG: hypothetical protein NZ741_03695, partial [Armatimonadetes bacterium]|nr:hypothetical protein [Armatimonadota bacterium]